MPTIQVLVLLLAVAAAAAVLAARLKIPPAIIWVLTGVVLALVPGLPTVALAPDLVLLMVLPPVIYSAAVAMSWREFRFNLRPISLLAVGLVVFTTVAVAAASHWLMGLAWPVGFVLGAIVSPPDPVAVLSLLRSPSLRVPRPIESILEGEGLLNDATALVAYRIAVAAAVTGVFSPLRAGAQFIVAAAGGVVIGIVVGYVVLRLHRLTRSVAVAENTVSLLTPYAAYLPADLIGASGVIAVVAAGMYVARNVTDIGSPAARLQNQAMWSIVTFLLESLVFILVGLELPSVTRVLTAGYPIAGVLREYRFAAVADQHPGVVFESLLRHRRFSCRTRSVFGNAKTRVAVAQ